MSAFRNGRPLVEPSDSTAARCLAIVEIGLARMMREETPAARLVAERRQRTQHPETPWRNIPGVTYPDQRRKRGPKGRRAVCPARRQAILDLYLARRSITFVASALHCGVHVIYRVLQDAGVEIVPRGGPKKKAAA